jgi:hypothetical protein
LTADVDADPEDALANAMTSRLPSASTKLSLLHAFFGLGATIAPFISTQFVKHVSKAYRYYTVAAAVAVFTALLLVLVFEGRTDDQVVGRRVTALSSGGGLNGEGDEEEAIPLQRGIRSDPSEGREQHEHEREDSASEIKQKEEGYEQEGGGGGTGDKMKRILKLRSVWAVVVYSFIYVSGHGKSLREDHIKGRTADTFRLA